MAEGRRSYGADPYGEATAGGGTGGTPPTAGGGTGGLGTVGYPYEGGVGSCGVAAGGWGGWGGGCGGHSLIGRAYLPAPRVP